MANELENLIVRVEADTTKLQKELDKAGGKVGDFERKTNRYTNQTAAAFDRLNASVVASTRTMAAGIVAAFGVSALSGITDATSKLAAVSEAVGLTAERYQVLAGAAKRASLDSSQFEGAIKKFSVSVAEARRESGGFYEFLKQALPTVAEQIRLSKDTSEAFDIVADATRRLATDEERALLAKQAFGDGAVTLAKELKNGSAAIDQAGVEAAKYGKIVSNESVKATAELAAELSSLQGTFSSLIAEGIGRMAPAVTSAIKQTKAAIADPSFQKALGMVGPAAATTSLLTPTPTGIGNLGGRAAVGVIGAANEMVFGKTQPAVAGKQDGDAYMTALETAQRAGWSRLTVAAKEWRTETSAALTMQVDKRKLQPGQDAIASLRQNAVSSTPGFENQIKAAGLAAKQEREQFQRMLEDKVIDDRQHAEARALIATSLSNKIAEIEKAELERKSAANDTITALQIQAAELQGRQFDAIALMYERELANFKKLLNDKLISEQQFAEARELLNVQMADKVKAAMEQEREHIRAINQEISGVFQNAASGVFSSIIEGSFNAKKAAVDLIKTLAEVQFKRAILGPVADGIFGANGSGGIIGDGLAGMFGGARAHGGPMSTGRAYLAGERGPELIVPKTSMQAINRMPVQSGGGAVYNIDARGADAGVEQRIYAVMATVERQRQNPVATVAKSRQRFPNRRV